MNKTFTKKAKKFKQDYEKLMDEAIDSLKEIKKRCIARIDEYVIEAYNGGVFADLPVELFEYDVKSDKKFISLRFCMNDLLCDYHYCNGVSFDELLMGRAIKINECVSVKFGTFSVCFTVDSKHYGEFCKLNTPSTELYERQTVECRERLDALPQQERALKNHLAIVEETIDNIKGKWSN